MASRTNTSLVQNNKQVLSNVLTWLRFMEPQAFANAYPGFPDTNFDFSVPESFGRLFTSRGDRVALIRVRYSPPQPNRSTEHYWEVRFDHHTYAALSVPLTVLARLRDFRFNAQDVLFSLLWSLQNHGRRVELEIGTVTMANHTVRVRGRNNTTTEVFAPVESAPLRIRLWYDNAATNTSTPSNSPAEVWTLGYHLCGKLRCKRVFQEGMCCEQHRPF